MAGIYINSTIIEEKQGEELKNKIATRNSVQLKQEKLQSIQSKALIKGMGEEIVKLKLERIKYKQGGV